ncbi:uncharacterized protein V2V93DRAFT_385301 [Kockiozyma suomiensis]|uniref:uncharacterized protein n=1 Tax=Kockiozyma suomiensis TaxID=1337062 RepID=UPI00334433ED
MSISRLAALVKAWPADSLKRQISLKTTIEEQLALYQRGQRSELPNLGGQIEGMQDLIENKSQKLYPLSDKLMKPAGKPTYYTALLHELEHGVQEPSRWQKLKVFFTNGRID